MGISEVVQGNLELAHRCSGPEPLWVHGALREHVMATTSWNSPLVRYQYHQATMLMRLVTNLISKRVGSPLVHTHSYPGELVLSLKPETRAAALAEFDHDLAAWQAAQGRC